MSLSTRARAPGFRKLIDRNQDEYRCRHYTYLLEESSRVDVDSCFLRDFHYLLSTKLSSHTRACAESFACTGCFQLFEFLTGYVQDKIRRVITHCFLFFFYDFWLVGRRDFSGRISTTRSPISIMNEECWIIFFLLFCDFISKEGSEKRIQINLTHHFQHF